MRDASRKILNKYYEITGSATRPFKNSTLHYLQQRGALATVYSVGLPLESPQILILLEIIYFSRLIFTFQNNLDTLLR